MSLSHEERNPDISVLVGKELTRCFNRNNEEIIFDTNQGEHYKLMHQQDCCESVYVEDVCGDLKDLVGTPILVAEEVTNIVKPDDTWDHINAPERERERDTVNDDAIMFDVDKDEDGQTDEYQDESFTWTFYRFRTIKGTVVIRFYGSSNGYYSESVDFIKMGV